MIGRRRRHDDETVDVRVVGGVVRGVRERGLLAWRGIPYAAPPVGGRRFASPAAVVPWEGTRDAIDFGSAAPQAFRNPLVHPPSVVIAADEDCLTVNVHAPIWDDHGSNPLPVMVYIHGGGYSVGSSRDFSGQGEGFVRDGHVVYVSFNYRLGPLGYLDFSDYSTPDRPLTSNLGLRDQVALLRWVRENIGAFGGDAENVTVFGASAGGNAVTTLMATPSARGLFARAIAQSPPPGAVYPPSMSRRWAGEYVQILRQTLESRGRHDAEESAEALPVPRTAHQLLTTASPSDLVAACTVLQIRTPDAYPGTFCLAPVIDGDFLPHHPLRAFRAGTAHRVPLIIGTNNREGAIFRGRVDILPRTPPRIEALFARAPAGSRRRMRAVYPGLPTRRAAADFGGDFGFWFPSTRVTDYHSRFAPTWAYRFDVAPRLLEILGLDATHGVEMFALFARTDLAMARLITAFGGAEEYAAAGQRMRTMWLRFAAGAPPEETWPSYREPDRSTLIIDVTDRVEHDPRRARRRAWEQFLPDTAW
ncbi:carboxylesterase/lipase family protein [Microbacterium sp. QXD-8]|uniref:Carboxylic ester hydrolase n=1 Tax=Microbacterium psychrotolerans TaxID=3068321 RepID=A0ABU0Z6U0_9MICO|nr:carboxylesterase/lipase family protein [Microbacterium sp. QXD-8]MDQ7880318.1 carboxylesterase/lipase family protein [Microbacterium sp. QXD-8]